jgi:trk system potassium uptake protein TrkH
MYTNRLFFGSKSNAKFVLRVIKPAINYLLMFVLIVLLIASIGKVGFNKPSGGIALFFVNHIFLLFVLIGLLYLLRTLICIGFKSFTRDFYVFCSITAWVLFSIIIDIDRNIPWLNNYYFYAFLVFGLFLFELSRFDIKNASLVLNPAQLFMISFALIIFTGSMLLMLPKSTTHSIKYVDALFTSTSAVCVTGLTSLDTAKDFTFLGKAIILLLIQIGGIGIMTFTSFFGYFFKGSSSSFSEKFVLSDFLNEDNVSEIAKTLMKVIFITLLIELIGATFIFFSLDTNFFQTIEQRVHFSVFHSISAFCNAGFSTLSGNLYDGRVSNSLGVLYSISFLIIFGGIGFPILLNIYTFCKIKFTGFVKLILLKQHPVYIPQIININTRLVLITTVFLLVVGTIFFLIFETSNTLAGMDLSHKIAHSFLGSVTPRTAGFNSVDYTKISVATAVLSIFLMWVGASPVSTGGGIKTSTFAIAILNVFRIAKMKPHIEFHNREIHERTVDRAFAIIILSIIILGCGSLVVYLIEPAQGALRILFECVSAFGTVGLSMGLTPNLSDASKLVLVGMMFMGRMGILTLLFAIIRKTKTLVYRYPKENIVIN